MNKSKVRKIAPDAYCVRLNDRTGYIVWPGKIYGRGFEQAAIGLGRTAALAWKSVRVKEEDGAMNKWKRICKSCGVEWVEDSNQPNATDCRVYHCDTCDSCCPQDTQEEQEAV